jgi:deferrochelatase/peroxidase EfeB
VKTQLWAQPGDGPSWMDGGAYLVTRKIRMHIETWDRTSLQEQEDIFGRDKDDWWGRTLFSKEA